MAENCTECKYEERLKYIDNDIRDLKANDKEYSKNMGDLRESHTETKTYVKEIKEGIAEIKIKLNDIETRPSKLLYSVAGGVIVAIIMVGINLLTKH